MSSADLIALPLPVGGVRPFDLSSSVRLADRHAADLLSSLGAGVVPPTTPEPLDAARDWAGSGLVPLIGLPDRAPLPGPAAAATCATGALAALRLLAGKEILPGREGAWLLGERAALLQWTRNGSVSPNGACRLLAAADGWLAVNLARPEDWRLVPAWLETEAGIGDWGKVQAGLLLRSAAGLEARARLLGLPVAVKGSDRIAADQTWFRMHAHGPRRLQAGAKPPLVVDLSSLWAGPLCGHLLSRAGARVIKVEDVRRPDGARDGHAEFYHLLNAHKESVSIDFGSAEGRRQLQRLIARADIVIEASRPRALRQLGIEAEEIVARRDGMTWISITGYGRREPQAQWVAFGDDAAVAAGATIGDPPIFCGDALSDPLTGLHAAVAAFAFWQNGGGVVVDLSLAEVTRYCLRPLTPPIPCEVVERGQQFVLRTGGREWPVAAPRRRPSLGRAVELGADTQHVMEELAVPC